MLWERTASVVTHFTSTPTMYQAVVPGTGHPQHGAYMMGGSLVIKAPSFLKALINVSEEITVP